MPQPPTTQTVQQSARPQTVQIQPQLQQKQQVTTPHQQDNNEEEYEYGSEEYGEEEEVK